MQINQRNAENGNRVFDNKVEHENLSHDIPTVSARKSSDAKNRVIDGNADRIAGKGDPMTRARTNIVPFERPAAYWAVNARTHYSPAQLPDAARMMRKALEKSGDTGLALELA